MNIANYVCLLLSSNQQNHKEYAVLRDEILLWKKISVEPFTFPMAVPPNILGNTEPIWATAQDLHIAIVFDCKSIYCFIDRPSSL